MKLLPEEKLAKRFVLSLEFIPIGFKFLLHIMKCHTIRIFNWINRLKTIGRITRP